MGVLGDSLDVRSLGRRFSEGAIKPLLEKAEKFTQGK